MRSFLVLLVCVSCVWSAPTKQEFKDQEFKNFEKFGKAENEIEELADLAGSKLKNVAFEKEKSFSYENNNGVVKSHKASESKVLNPQTGSVVSDIKQETIGDKTKTEVDIPDAGIHEKIISNEKTKGNGVQKMDDYDYSGAFKYTPSAVAEYLFQTGDFQELEEALRELVNTSIMTQDQADKYREDVRKEYNILVQQASSMAKLNMPEDKQNSRILNDYSTLSDIYRMFGYNDVIPHLGMDELQSKEIMRMALARATSLIQVIKTLMDEWLTRAIVTGDPDAETLLSDILKRVSKDDNPDDLGQMREILYDIFANEVLSSLEKRPLSDYDEEYLDSEYDSNKAKDETSINQVEKPQMENMDKDLNKEETLQMTEKGEVDNKGEKTQKEDNELPVKDTLATASKQTATKGKDGGKPEKDLPLKM